MRYVKGIIATSHIDRHGDMLSPEGLKNMVEQINSQYIPFMVEHDPRIPPQGRMKSAKLIKLEDGHYAVEGINEIFEEGDEIEVVDSSREMPLPIYDREVLQITYDRSYRDDESQLLINDISSLLGSSPQKYEKKAIEPISILIIGGFYLLGKIASGFFNKLGSDAWEALRGKLKILFEKKKNEAKENLLMFQLSISAEGLIVNTEVIITNPSDDDIDSFFEKGLSKLDQILPSVIKKYPEVKKIVFTFSDNDLSLLFSVRKDAFPISPSQNPDRNDY